MREESWTRGEVTGGWWLVFGEFGWAGAKRRPSFFHQPPTTNHQPPTTNHQPPTTNHQPPTTNHQPPTTNHQPPTTNHQPPTTNHQFPAGLLLQDFHRHPYQPLQLLIGRFRQQCLRPHMVLARRIPIQQPPHVRDQRDALDLRPALYI